MENKKTGKIIALIVAIVIVVAGASVGVMAARGVFSSGKQEAFDLLAQAGDKLSESPINDYLGYAELTKSMNEESSMIDMQISNLQLDPTIAPTGVDLSEFTAELGSQYDVKEQKTNVTLNIAKGGSTLSANIYEDKDKMIVSVPELVNGKVFQLDPKMGESVSSQANMQTLPSEDIKEFQEDIIEFFEKEIEKLKDDMSCEKLEDDKEGYQLTITKEAMDTMINDFVAFMEGQEKVVGWINSYAKTLGQTLPSSNGTENFDLISGLKTIAEELSKYTQDFTFSVYGENGNLTGLETVIAVENTPFTISLTFEGEKGNSTATLKISGQDASGTGSLTVVKKSMEGDTLDTALTADLSVNDISFGTLSFTESLSKADNGYSFIGTVSSMGSELANFTCTGSVKDLKPGSYVDVILDDVSLEVQGKKLFSLAIDTKIGKLDGSVEPPEGETVEVKSLTDYAPYATEIQMGIIKLMADWEISVPNLSDLTNLPNQS
ncbi:MAG: hypothetical protein J1F22_02040 [Lachnospiraceae bacterium]|nr:hypothetical protein [Lachnospiraceae bacterium]